MFLSKVANNLVVLLVSTSLVSLVIGYLLANWNFNKDIINKEYNTPKVDDSNFQPPEPLKSTADLPLVISEVAKHALNKGYKNPVVNVWYNDGNYSRGDLKEYGYYSGTGWFAVKVNNKREVLDIGQGTTECPNLRAKYNIPKDSFPDCF